jgi:ABC-2 type transport system permease protein
VAVLIVGALDLPGFVLDVFLASVVFFLLGLALYSLLFAAVGATVSRQSEAQGAAMPITLFLLVPYFISLTYVPEEPDSAFAVAASIFPLSSPLIMPTRVAVGSPSGFEVALAVALLYPTIALVAWVGGGIYSRTLLSGGRIGILEALRGLRPARDSGSRPG